MVIKNKGQNAVQLESAVSTASVNLSKCIEISFNEGISFLKPGEYEYQGIDIISREVSEQGNFKACSNISRVTVEGVRILLLLNSIEAKQDDLSQILDIDVLIITENDLEKLDRLVMLYNPQKVIIIQEKLKEEEIREHIKKSFSTAEVTVERQLKTKREDYGGENFVVNFTILRK